MAKKVGIVTFSPKQYTLVPVYKYGGFSTSSQEDRSLRDKTRGNQMFRKFDYDINFIDMNMFVKNLKTATVELRERVYVDKPL